MEDEKLKNPKKILLFLNIITLMSIIATGCSAKLTDSTTEKQKTSKKQEYNLSTSSEPKEEKHLNTSEEPNKSDKVAYLTFDDGPGEYTSQVLNILNENKIKATFFVIGPHAEKYKDFVKQEKKDGDYVGLHSMTHDYKTLYTQGQFVNEMKQVQQILQHIIGTRPVLCRPPYGSKPGLTQNLRDEVATANLKIWDWTIDSLDWKYNQVPFDKSVPEIVNNVLSQATEKREVILMHDIHPQSVQALPQIIQGLKEKGYTFKTYSENEHFSLNFWKDTRL
ncbi:peptidoglycan-N-acetylglucosamine deacetylase [Bacillus cereus]|uniref:polysaccharide deacetylase family protein n=1 Tax=Bacillus cereus TaxID=1396 RepID=UPI0009D5D6CC|nr:peptidoglycan-N-acetylglucosamine deacetylase [Bacillus cereus]